MLQPRQPHPRTPELRFPTKNKYDGTKLSVEPSRPKTTTYGRKYPFQLNSISQKRATFSPTSPRPSMEGLGVRSAATPDPQSRLSPGRGRRAHRATGEGS